MRNFKLLLMPIVLTVASIISAQSVSNPIRNLCYKVTFTENQKVVSTADFSQLQTTEILNFQTKTAVKKIHKYFVNGYYTYDVVYLYHDNYFPKWYMVADTIRLNQEGTFSIFTSYNQNLVGGWGGYNYAGRNANGIYGDSRGGSGYPWNYYKTSHTTKGYESYLEESQMYYQYGLQYKILYTLPTSQLIQYYSNLGYTVQTTSTYVKIFNTEVSFTWIINEKKLITEFFETTGTVKTKVISEYNYNLEFGDNVLTKRTTSTPVTFSTGDCGEHEVVETFTEYSKSCEFTDTRSAAAEKEIKSKISVSPNPTSDNIAIVLNGNASDEHLTNIKVINIEGKVVLNVTLYNHSNETNIDLINLPSGYYILQVGTSVGNQFNENIIKN